MSFLSHDEILKLNFQSVGNDVLISDKAVFYRPERIKIGNHVRIDDFCVLANNIILHDYIHIALKANLLSSNNAVIEMENYTGVGYQATIFTETDDFVNAAFINPMLPKEYRNVVEKSVYLKKFSSVGAGSMVIPGVTLQEGATVGSMSLVMQTTKPWMCYFGVPARAVAKRNEAVMALEKEFIEKYGHK